MMMRKSPIHPKYEASYYDAYGFDLQEDFSQFLKEARQHEMAEAKLKSSSVYPEGGEGKKEGSSETEKEKGKKKKSWKISSVVSWWKAEKKSNLRVGPTTTNSNMNPSGKRKGHVSGPIYTSNCGKGPNVKKQWPPNSGPLITGLFFKPTKREEDNEIPYMSLHHQQNSPQAVNNYGPLYTVT